MISVAADLTSRVLEINGHGVEVLFIKMTLDRKSLILGTVYIHPNYIIDKYDGHRHGFAEYYGETSYK